VPFKMFGFDGLHNLGQTQTPTASPWVIAGTLLAIGLIATLIVTPEVGRCPGLKARYSKLRRRGDEEEASITKYEAQRYGCAWSE